MLHIKVEISFEARIGIVFVFFIQHFELCYMSVQEEFVNNLIPKGLTMELGKIEH